MSESNPKQGKACGDQSARRRAGKPPKGKGDRPGRGQDEDVLLVLGQAPSGRGLNVLRNREDRLETGELRPVVEGKPLDGELVRLTPREQAPGLYDVDVQFDGSRSAPGDASSAAASASPGAEAAAPMAKPAQVATKKYRRNYARIFDRGPSASNARKRPVRSKKHQLN